MTDTSTRPLAHPVVAFAQRAVEVVGSLSEAQAWALLPDEQARVLVDLNTLGNQVAELQLRVLAAADNNGVGSETAVLRQLDASVDFVVQIEKVPGGRRISSIAHRRRHQT